MNKTILTALLLVAGAAIAQAAEPLPRETLCASNPAFSASIMLTIVQTELQKDHDPSLDAEAPEKLAQDAAAQGITDCASELEKDPATYQALLSLQGADRTIGWDAYNTACADRKSSKGDCIRNEVGAEHALRHMSTTDSPAGAKTLVQTCALVLQTDPVMTEWRECVDQALAVHAPEASAYRCKLSVGWHSAKTGAQAGRTVSQCLKGG